MIVGQLASRAFVRLCSLHVERHECSLQMLAGHRLDAAPVFWIERDVGVNLRVHQVFHVRFVV